MDNGTSSPRTVTPVLVGAAQRAAAAEELRTNRLRVLTAYGLATLLTGGFVVTDVVTEVLWPTETELAASELRGSIAASR